nr:hypothetical protein Iba_scaffold43298CG0260 [Ipomoea batatas]
MEREGYQLCGLVKNQLRLPPMCCSGFFNLEIKKEAIEACDSNSLVIRTCNMLPFPTPISPNAHIFLSCILHLNSESPHRYLS